MKKLWRHLAVIHKCWVYICIASYPGSTQLFDRTREKQIVKLGGDWIRGYICRCGPEVNSHMEAKAHKLILAATLGF